MKKTLLAMAFVALLPLTANAAERSYTYVEGTYNNIDSDIDGFGVRAAVAFADTGLYGLGTYQNFSESGADVDFWELGLGYALGLSDSLDLIAEAAHTDFDIADGYRASVGLRGNFTDSFEGLVKSNYRNIEGADGDFTATLGLQYRFSPTWGVTGEIEFDDSAEIYTLGLRASF